MAGSDLESKSEPQEDNPSSSFGDMEASGVAVDEVDALAGNGYKDGQPFDSEPQTAETEEADRGVTEESFLYILWKSGVCRLFPMLFLYIAGFGIILPFVPNLMTNFFASEEAGHEMHCQSYNVHSKPQACHDASDIVVWWASVTSFCTNTVLAFAVSPMTGVWSDIVGRKPFLIIAQVLSMLPKAVILLHYTSGLSLYWYYPMDVVNGVVSPITISLAVVADLLPAQHRSLGFGLVLGAFAGGIAVTPRIGNLLGLESAIRWGVGMKCVALIYTQVCVPESTQVTTRANALEQFREKQATHRRAPLELVDESDTCCSLPRGIYAVCRRIAQMTYEFPPIKSMLQGLAIIVRYPEFVKLMACLMTAAFVQGGMSEVDNQYLINIFNFKSIDFANRYMVWGIGSLIVQAVLMAPLMKLFGDRGCLIIAFMASIVKALGFFVATTRFEVYSLLGVYTLGMLAFPSISSIKANHVGPHEQGAMQGALNGAQSLAAGLGPIFFSRVWHLFANPTDPSSASFRMPMLVQAVLSSIPVVIIATLNMQQLDIRHKHRNASLSRPQQSESQEPLLPASTPLQDSGHRESLSRPTGHLVLVEEAGLVHRDDDLSTGMWLEGDVHHNLTKQESTDGAE